MANQYRSITPSGVQQIFSALCADDPRCASFRLGDFAEGETKANDQYPCILFELVDCRIESKAAMTYNAWKVRLYVFDQRRSDWANVMDAFNDTHVLLNDILLRFRKGQQYRDWGFLIEGSFSIDYVIRQDRDDLVGCSAEVSFLTPLTICLGEIPSRGTIPDAGLFYSGVTASSPTFLTCSTLEQCSIIGSIRQDISDLQSLTGGTGSFDCSSLLSCPDFQSLSAQTQGNTASIVAIGNDVAAVQSDVLELSAFTFSHTDTLVQPGDNIITGGTDFRPIVSVSPTPEFESITAFQGIYSGEGATNINELFAPSDVLDYLIEGANISIRNNLSGTKSIAVTASPSFNALSASTLTSGTTELSIALANKFNSVYAPISVVPTYVQPGTNTTTGGTLTRPTVNVVASPAFTKVTADQFVSGTTELGTLFSAQFAPISVLPTYVQAGLNTTTGGTITRPIVNVVGSPSFTSVTANNFISGGTNLSSVFAPISVVPTYVQGGSNTTTGGTITRPTVNVSSAPSFTSVSATTISANTFSRGSIAQANVQSVSLSSDVVFSGASATDITGLSFAVDPFTKYTVQVVIAFSSSGTTTGPAFSMNGPAGTTLFSALVTCHQSSGMFSRFLSSLDDFSTGAAGTVAAANTNYTALLVGTLVTGANAGTFILRGLRGGTANNVTVKAGTSGVLTKL